MKSLLSPLLLITYFDSLYMSPNKRRRKTRGKTSEPHAGKLYELFSFLFFPLVPPPLPAPTSLFAVSCDSFLSPANEDVASKEKETFVLLELILHTSLLLQGPQAPVPA